MSIKTKLIILFLAFTAVPVALVGTMIYTRARDAAQQETIARLKVTADAKAHRLTDFFTERMGDLEVAQSRDLLTRQLPILDAHLDDRENPDFIQAWTLVNAQMTAFKKALDYNNVILVDPRGRVLLAVDPDRTGHRMGDPFIDPGGQLLEHARTGRCLSDIYIDRQGGGNYEIAAAGPVLNEAGELAGIIVLEINLEPMFETIAESKLLGTTGEMVIVRREGDAVRFLSPLRFRPEAKLDFVVPFIPGPNIFPAQAAVMGGNGEGPALDYRGAPVLAAWRFIPSLNWGLAVKLDTKEALAPATALRDWILGLGLAAVLLGAALAWLIGRSITGPLLAVEHGAEIIGRGNLDHRIDNPSPDEVGQLARSINQMTERLKTVTASRDELNAEIVERRKAEADAARARRALRTLSETNQMMVRAATEDELLHKACEILVKFGGYRLAWIGYKIDDAAHGVKFMAQAGIEPGYLEQAPMSWADDERGQGPVGTAIRTGEPALFQDFAAGPALGAFQTEAVRRGYASAMALPLFEDGRVLGALVIFAAEPMAFGEEEARLLRELADDISFGVSHLRTQEKKQRAEEEARRHEALLHQVIGNAPIILHTLDRNETVTLSEGKGLAALGRQPGHQAVGRTLTELYADHPEVIAANRRALAGESFHAELHLGGVVLSSWFEPIRGAGGEITGALGVSTDISEVHRANAYNRSLIEASLDPLVTIGPDGRITDVNQATERAAGRTRAELIGSDFSDYFTEPDRARAGYEQVFKEGAVTDYPLEVRRSDGTVIPVRYNAAVYRDEQGEVVGVFAAARDISERRRAEAEAARANRALLTLSRSNEVLVRAEDEAELLNSVCRILTEIGGYRMAWIGYKQNDPVKTVKPMAHCGHEDGYLEQAAITWDDSPRGSGPTGTAIKTGKPYACQHFLTDPAFTPWREPAAQRGYAASLSVPLFAAGQTLGALMVYSSEPEAFHKSEVRLLSELANDLSFGIAALRTREALNKAHAELERRVEERTAELRESQQELALRNAIAEVFLTMPDEEGYSRVLDLILKTMDCPYGTLGYIDDEGNLVAPFLTPAIYPECQVPDQKFIYPPHTWGGLWGRALRERCTIVSDGPFNLPTGHLPVKNYLAVPILYQDQPLGIISVGNKDAPFDQRDCRLVERLAEYIAPVIQARVRRTALEKERRRSEEALRESEERFRSTLDLMAEGCQIIGHDWRYLYINDTAEAHNRRPKEELIGQKYMDAWPGIEETEVFRLIKHTLEQRVIERMENEFVFPDGRKGWFDLIIQPVPEGVFILSVDITQRKKLELELQAHHEHLEQLVADRTAEVSRTVEVLRQEVIERERAENAIQVRLRLTQMGETLGLDDFLQQTLDEIAAATGSTIGFYHFVEPDQKTISLQTWSSRTLQEFCRAEGKGRHYDLELAGVWADCLRERRAIIHNDYAGMPNKRGLPPGHAEVIRELVAPISRGGKVVAIFGVGNKADDYTGPDVELVNQFADTVWDIVERKRAEAAQARAEQELAEQRTLAIRSDRLRSLGEMAAGMAHELNQPLSGIRGLAEHLLIGLERKWELSADKTRDKIERIVGQADRMTHVIEHVRSFARGADGLEAEPVDVNQVIQNGLSLLGAQLESLGVRVQTELGDGLPPVLANPFSLEEVVINLINNARDALEENLQRGAQTEAARVLVRTGLAAGPDQAAVTIEIADNGPGVAAEVQDKIFTPFFSTKPAHKGTGLGLSISRNIIERFEGRLDLASEPGRGVTATISLPVVPAPAPAPGKNNAPP